MGQKLQVLIAKAGQLDVKGRLWTKEALEALAESDEKLTLDAQGNLWSEIKDKETDELDKAIKASFTSNVEVEDIALCNFVEVLKEREQRGLPGLYPIREKTINEGNSPGWITVEYTSTPEEEE